MDWSKITGITDPEDGAFQGDFQNLMGGLLKTPVTTGQLQQAINETGWSKQGLGSGSSPYHAAVETANRLALNSKNPAAELNPELAAQWRHTAESRSKEGVSRANDDGGDFFSSIIPMAITVAAAYFGGPALAGAMTPALGATGAAVASGSIIGGGMSAIQGGDPIKGALLGGAGGALSSYTSGLEGGSNFTGPVETGLNASRITQAAGTGLLSTVAGGSGLGSAAGSLVGGAVGDATGSRLAGAVASGATGLALNGSNDSNATLIPNASAFAVPIAEGRVGSVDLSGRTRQLQQLRGT